jgi:hypothetical protein
MKIFTRNAIAYRYSAFILSLLGLLLIATTAHGYTAASVQKFVATPTTVTSDAPVKLSWKTVGTSGCNLFDVTLSKTNPNLVEQDLPTSGTYSAGPLAKYAWGTKVTYRISCQDASTQKDRVVEKDVTVFLKPQPKASITKFVANPGIVKTGPAKLSWVSVGTSNCNLFDVTNPKKDPNLVEPELKTSGSHWVYPAEKYKAGKTVIYRLRCQDASTQKDRVVEEDIKVRILPSLQVLGASTPDLEALAQALATLTEILAALKK